MSETLATLITVTVIIGGLAAIIHLVGKKYGPGARHPILCPGCQQGLQNVGFVSWTYQRGGQLFLITLGVGKPTPAFLDDVRAPLDAAPAPSTPGNTLHTLGSVTLFDCPRCATHFTTENKENQARSCSTENWARLTSG